ncbi:MAG: phage tail protein [Oscillospiraceae bacterium]|nr:phage tail protein [Oscillospiraceae bacterium]
MLGAIGTRDIDDVIVFEVSPEHILTIKDFIRRNSVRFAETPVVLRKPVSEYLGPDLDKLTFKITLKAQHGVNPQVQFNKLIHLQRDGTTLTLLIGPTAFGVFRWRIENLSIPWEIIDNQGRCISSEVSISLKEYV